MKKAQGTEASFEVAKNVLFVRTKIISNKLKQNPYRKGDTEAAWTQSIQISNQ